MKRLFLFFAIVFVLFSFAATIFPAKAEDLAKLFPDISSWQKKGSVENYFPENLYEYIDGAAENFLNYDFKRLAVQNYANAQGQSLSAEIYFHGTAENAFGIYSSEKPSSGNYFALGSQAYAETGILNFICAAFYVKLSGFDLGRDKQDALIVLGRAIADKIDTKAALPELLHAFPADGKVPNSERFILNNFLGHDFLHSAYVADYQVQGQNFQLFIIDAANEKEARTMLEKYMALAKEKASSNFNPGALMINDPYNGPIRLFWRGKFICGSSSQTPAAAETIAVIAKNLEKY